MLHRNVSCSSCSNDIVSPAELYASECKSFNHFAVVFIDCFFSTGRQCQDEDDMRKLVEDFYCNFTRTYKIMKKRNKNLIKLNTKSNHCIKKELDSANLW